ncbi:MAG: hypothetical protein ACT4PT_11535 [Methanobacteriota archaeon]
MSSASLIEAVLHAARPHAASARLEATWGAISDEGHSLGSDERRLCCRSRLGAEVSPSIRCVACMLRGTHKAKEG